MTDARIKMTQPVRVAQHIRTGRYATLEFAPKIWEPGSFIETVLLAWVARCGTMIELGMCEWLPAKRWTGDGRGGQIWADYGSDLKKRYHVAYKKKNDRYLRAMEFHKKDELYRILGITLLD